MEILVAVLTIREPGIRQSLRGAPFEDDNGSAKRVVIFYLSVFNDV